MILLFSLAIKHYQCVEVEEAMVLEPENASPASGIQPGDTEGLAESSAAVAPPNAYRSRAQLQEVRGSYTVALTL